ncbi:diguanylate cyclase [Lysobacter sp. A421]
MTGHAKRKRLLLARRIYPFRILGMGLSGLAVAAVLHQLKASPGAWAFVAFSALVWPHLAYRMAVSSADPARAETRNLLIDSAIAGALAPLMHFNLLPSVLIITLATVDKISTGIPGLWIRSMPGLLLALAATTVLTGAAFTPTTTMSVLVACLPVLLIHTIAVSWGSNKLIRKISQQNSVLDQIRRIDTLTGLSRRGDWEEQAERLLSSHPETDGHACILLIDIDHFKQVNDLHGHGAGDEVLRQVADRLRKTLRPHDRVGRIGGDEFAVLLPDTSEHEAGQVAERFRVAVEALQLPDYPDLRPTISIGLAPFPTVDADLRAWLNSADNALYRAKNQGRNCVST